MASLSGIFNGWHFWPSNGKLLLSDESTKSLQSFDTADEAINWLYLSGHKDVARHLHACTKDTAHGHVQPVARNSGVRRA